MMFNMVNRGEIMLKKYNVNNIVNIYIYDFNHVLLVKIALGRFDIPSIILYLLYIGIVSTPFINQPTNGKRTSMDGCVSPEFLARLG